MAADNLQVTVAQLTFDVTNAQVALDSVNKKFGVTTEQIRVQQKEIDALVAKENELLKRRDKAQSPNAVARYNEEIRKTRAAINDLTKATDLAAQTGGKIGAALQKTSADAVKTRSSIKAAFEKATFVAAKAGIDNIGKGLSDAGKEGKKLEDNIPGVKKPIKIKFDGDPIKFLKELGDAGVPVQRQIKLLTNALLELDENSPEFEPTKAALTQLKDEFGDFKQDLNANVGEPLERIQGNFQSFAQSIITLDFKQANKALGGLAAGIKALKFSDAVGGIKSLGKNLFDLGKALLSNPLFLLATLIILIILNFDKLRKATGLLGTVFKAIGAVVDFVVQIFKDLSDAIGLSTFAIDKQIKATEDLIDANQKLADQLDVVATRNQELFESEERLRISLIKNADERNKALAQLDDDLIKQKLEANDAQYNIAQANLDAQDKILDLMKQAGEEFNSDGVTQTEEFKKATEKRLELYNKRNETTAQYELLNNQLQINANDRAREEEEKAQKAREDAQKKWEDYWKQRTRIFEDEAKKLRQAIIDNRLFDIDQNLVGVEQVQARFAVQREQIIQTAEEDKKAAKEILNKADYRLFELEVAKRVAVQLVLNTKQQAAAEIEAARKVADDKAELIKKTADFELELEQNNTLAILDQYDQKLEVIQAYYDARVAAAIAAGKLEEAALLELEGKVLIAKTKKDQLTALLNAQAAELDETQRHALAMLGIEEASQAEILQAQIDYEKERLQQMEDSGQASEQELINQEDKIVELEAEKNKALKALDEERVQAFVEGIGATTDAAIDGATKVFGAQIAMLDKLKDAQQRRVDDAKDIAETGNAELLELEQARLDALNKKRAAFVRAQQALSAVELVINSAVAVSKAAAEGGAAAPFTIAATLIALIAGLAEARAIASQAAFYEGGLYSEKEGYTGRGNPRGVADGVGRKPYTYHNEEFIFNHQTTGKYKDIFDGVHRGRIDLRDWQRKAESYDRLRAMMPMRVGQAYMLPAGGGNANEMELHALGEKIEKVGDILKSQDRLAVNITEKGLAIVATRYMAKMDKIKALTK
jgi:hypothetical protein